MESSVTAMVSMSSDEMCPTHKTRRFKYVCMDLACSKNPTCCILCVKNNHSDCDDKLIIEKQKLAKKLVLKHINSQDMEDFREDIKKILQEMHAYLTQKYKKYMSQSLDYLSSETMTLNKLITPEALKGMKTQCNIAIQESGQIVISPKIDPGKINIKEDIRSFKEDIRTLMDKFTKDLNEIKFNPGGEMTLKEFTWHKNLSKSIMFVNLSKCLLRYSYPVYIFKGLSPPKLINKTLP